MNQEKKERRSNRIKEGTKESGVEGREEELDE